jgi:excinuclease ABC subunit B
LIARAIGNIVESLAAGEKYVVLKGATGTGKTFAMAQTISRSGRPSLILCHNKTLATQLARELKGFFPDNAVELFVSYYSYYQPEAYLTAADTYIAKTSVINDELDALRHRATKSLFERDDVIVVASVSCIYGLGLPSNYLDARITVSKGVDLNLKDFAESLQANLYVEQSVAAKDLERGSFTVEHSAFGSEVIVWPPYEESAVRVRFTNGKVTSVRQLLDGFVPTEVQDIVIYPARHHVTPEEEMVRACEAASINMHP